MSFRRRYTVDDGSGRSSVTVHRDRGGVVEMTVDPAGGRPQGTRRGQSPRAPQDGERRAVEAMFARRPGQVALVRRSSEGGGRVREYDLYRPDESEVLRVGVLVETTRDGGATAHVSVSDPRSNRRGAPEPRLSAEVETAIARHVASEPRQVARVDVNSRRLYDANALRRNRSGEDARADFRRIAVTNDIALNGRLYVFDEPSGGTQRVRIGGQGTSQETAFVRTQITDRRNPQMVVEVELPSGTRSANADDVKRAVARSYVGGRTLQSDANARVTLDLGTQNGVQRLEHVFVNQDLARGTLETMAVPFEIGRRGQGGEEVLRVASGGSRQRVSIGILGIVAEDAARSLGRDVRLGPLARIGNEGRFGAEGPEARSWGGPTTVAQTFESNAAGTFVTLRNGLVVGSVRVRGVEGQPIRFFDVGANGAAAEGDIRLGMSTMVEHAAGLRQGASAFAYHRDTIALGYRGRFLGESDTTVLVGQIRQTSEAAVVHLAGNLPLADYRSSLHMLGAEVARLTGKNRVVLGAHGLSTTFTFSPSASSR